MMDGRKASGLRAVPGGSAPEADAEPKAFRSLQPGEERAAAAAQIQRTLKAWRASKAAAADRSADAASGRHVEAQPKTPADVRAFCASDAIARQKLDDVD